MAASPDGLELRVGSWGAGAAQELARHGPPAQDAAESAMECSSSMDTGSDFLMKRRTSDMGVARLRLKRRRVCSSNSPVRPSAYSRDEWGETEKFCQILAGRLRTRSDVHMRVTKSDSAMLAEEAACWDLDTDMTESSASSMSVSADSAAAGPAPPRRLFPSQLSEHEPMMCQCGEGGVARADDETARQGRCECGGFSRVRGGSGGGGGNTSGSGSSGDEAPMGRPQRAPVRTPSRLGASVMGASSGPQPAGPMPSASAPASLSPLAARALEQPGKSQLRQMWEARGHAHLRATESSGFITSVEQPGPRGGHRARARSVASAADVAMGTDGGRAHGAKDAGQADRSREFALDVFHLIRSLPPLDKSRLCPTPLLPPQDARDRPTLVLDLDETLVHSSIEPIRNADFEFPVLYNDRVFKVYTKKRPHVDTFLKTVSQWYEVVVFTASQEIYARHILDLLDQGGQIIDHKLYRESCYVVEGNYLKELSVLGRDLKRTVIVDNSPAAFAYQLDNGVPIESWFDAEDDIELLRLLPFLHELAQSGNVCPLIRDKFKLQAMVHR